MLATTGLEFQYNRKTKMDFPDVLCGRGEQWLILGESGSGKTTLLHLLGGLRKPQKGQIVIGDTDITSLSGQHLDIFRGRNIGIVFQQAHFVRSLTIQDNLLLAQKLAGMSTDLGQVHQLLARLNIEDKANDKPHRLSVGERQRASICRALINRPRLILADEPTSALDDHNCQEVIQLIKNQAAADEVTLLIVTHDNRLRSQFEHQIVLNN